MALDSNGSGHEAEAFRPKLSVLPQRFLLQTRSNERFGENMIYADPGSGVLIWQLLLAVFFGCAFYFSKLKHWATAKLSPKNNTLAQESPTDVSAPASVPVND